MHLDGPILDRIKFNFSKVEDNSVYPFSLPVLQSLEEIVFPTQVTFFVGENGTGKSTILEALAARAGFGAEGGSKNIHFSTVDEKYSSCAEQLAENMTLSWRQKPRDGYFFRAESFFNLATRIEEIDPRVADYGGKSLHAQSHGESFLAFFVNRLGGGGFYVFDEPEAALSPQRQLALLRVMYDLCKHPKTQFVVATHSPLLLAYPDATIYSFDTGVLQSVAYTETRHYEITKGFLDSPEQYFKHLFSE